MLVKLRFEHSEAWGAINPLANWVTYETVFIFFAFSLNSSVSRRAAILVSCWFVVCMD